ncbi:MAG: hypothetical protein LBR92_01845 [Puniceicoccales bacterium]|jgi:hypothetical protein|nr:hypothetical protein [Puniceicoccales bacterium]
MESAGDGNPNHFALHLDFGVSENIRNLAAAFGGREVVGAFSKMVGDLPFQPLPEELTAAEAAIEAAEAKRAAERAKGTLEKDLPKIPPMPTVTNLGERAKAAEAGTPQELTTGGAVKITLRKLQG